MKGHVGGRCQLRLLMASRTNFPSGEVSASGKDTPANAVVSERVKVGWGWVIEPRSEM